MRVAMVDLMSAIPLAASCTDSWITLIPLVFMLTASPRRVFACGIHQATRLHSGGSRERGGVGKLRERGGVGKQTHVSFVLSASSCCSDSVRVVLLE
jgi:hypothetical protein